MHRNKIRDGSGHTPTHGTLSVDVRIWDLGVEMPSFGRAQRESGPVCGERWGGESEGRGEGLGHCRL